MRTLKKNKDGNLTTLDNRCLTCPYGTDAVTFTPCNSQCAFYSETSDNYLKYLPNEQKYAYCMHSDNYIHIGVLPKNQIDEKSNQDIKKIKADYDAVCNEYKQACVIVQEYVQQNKLGLGGENIFELLVKHATQLKNEPFHLVAGSLYKCIGWQGGNIWQIEEILRRTKQLCLTHKEAGLSGEWEQFKAEIYALRLQLGILNTDKDGAP